ncbi:hypothetical protein [Salinihabitans flavidus]|nr:hypothetical protein [Salinihabitans flavidus]
MSAQPAAAADAAVVPGWRHRQVIYESGHVRLEYSGPEPARGDPVLVVFPPVDYPFDPALPGWGARSLAKRGIAHICVCHAAEDWHQYPDFFDAMAAARAFVGPGVQIGTYGYSMGGYGAFLGARTLGAVRAVAVSPQVSIDPAVVPFERRYDAQWAAMDGWRHDLAAQMDGAREYMLLYDPLHGKDRRHEALFPKPAQYRRVPIHGSGHAAIQTFVDMGLQEVFFDLLRGRTGRQAFRRAYRGKRAGSFRYVRKMGTRLHQRGHPMAARFLELAQDGGFQRLLRKWRPYHDT